MGTGLRKRVNLGDKSVAWLQAAGVPDERTLRRLGPVAAFRRVEQAGFKPSINLLYALEGALENVRWDRLTPARRSELIRELDASRDLGERRG